MSVHPVEPDGALTAPPARDGLASLLRDVNRRIAARAHLPVTAFACECAGRGCEEAVEVPLAVFRVVDARPGLYVVRAGHDAPPLERVVRRDRGYVVVQR